MKPSLKRDTRFNHFNTKSASELGTLYHTAVTVHPEKNVKASGDYLTVMLHTHVIAAVKVLLSQRNFDQI